MDIFNISYFQASVSTCFETIALSLIPKSSNVSCLNYYHSVDFASINYERLWKIAYGTYKENY